MWCLNCGRKQPQNAGYCQHCGETKEIFAADKPKTPDAVFAKNLRMQSMASYFIVLSGLLLVILEVATVAVYAVNIFRLIISENIVMENFYASMSLQEPFATIFSVISLIAIGLTSVSMILMGAFTKTRKRKVLSFVSGGLLFVWLLLDIFGVTDAMGIGTVIGAMVLTFPMIIGYFGHPYLAKSAVGAIVRMSLATLTLFLLPFLFDWLIDLLFGMFGIGDFAGLCDPFVALVTIVVIAVTQISAVSRMALFFSQLPDLCRPRRVKKAPAGRQQMVDENAPKPRRRS